MPGNFVQGGPERRMSQFERQARILLLDPTIRHCIAGLLFQFLERLAEDIRAHGGRVLLLTDIAGKREPSMRVLKVEPLGLGLGTLVDSVYIQLLVHELALRAGLEPGKFWIAQDVTREE